MGNGPVLLAAVVGAPLFVIILVGNLVSSVFQAIFEPTGAPTLAPTTLVPTPSPVATTLVPTPSPVATTPSLYNIRLVNTGTIDRYDSLFQQAAARWESVIENDLSDVQGAAGVDLFAGLLSERSPDMGISSVDDLIIGYELRDEPGVDLVGPTFIRDDDLTPLAGVMLFDSVPFSMNSAGVNYITILREMGRVLGIGTLWGPSDANCIFGCSVDSEVVQYTCRQATIAYQALRNRTNFTVGMSTLQVSSDNQDGCVSWASGSFDADDWVELMVEEPIPSNRSVLLTTVTLAALQDLSPSYVTNQTQADDIPLLRSDGQQPQGVRRLRAVNKNVADDNKKFMVNRPVFQFLPKNTAQINDEASGTRGTLVSP